MFAIIKVQGKQYLIAKGDILEIAKLKDAKKDGIITIKEVLLYVDRSKNKVGQPYVSGARVKAKVIDPLKRGKKIEVLKFKPKKRYTKKLGFRPQLTVLKIQDIICK